MLEICPSIASDIPSLEVHALGIGGKADPARLVFNGTPGEGLNVALMDMGDRYRMLVNKVEVVENPDLPKLPVARDLSEMLGIECPVIDENTDIHSFKSELRSNEVY